MNLLAFIKKNKSAIVKKVLLFIFFTIITIVFYNGLDKIYFQQDEWFKAGKSIYFWYADFGRLWTNKFGFHYYPLLNIFFIIEYLIFKLNVPYYLYLGVALQSIAGMFFYELTKKLFKNTVLPLFLSVLLLINPGIYQVITNEMVSLYIIVLIFILAMFIYIFNQINKGIELGTKKLICLLISYVFLTFFFEGSLILIVLIPVFYFLFKSDKTFIRRSLGNISVVVLTIVFTIFRLFLQVKLPVDAPLPIQGSFALTTIYNAATTPFKFFIEYLFGLNNILYISDIYTRKIFVFVHEPGINLALANITTGYEVLVYYLTAFLLVVTVIIISLTHKDSAVYKRNINILILGAVWLIMNSIVISPQGRIFTIPEPRYLYISGVGVLWLFGAILMLIWDKYKNIRIIKITAIGVVLVYLFAWGIYSYHSIDREKGNIIKVSEVRSNLIDQIKAFYPKLPDSAVFYIYCSDDCTSNMLYGMPKEWVVPFQSGLGWTLLTVYSTDNPRKYAPFFSNYLFWDSKSAGYKKIGKTAFGFFTDIKELKKTIKEHSLNPSDIIVLKYESKRYKLTPVKNYKEIIF
jgi:hypothetical protein